MNSMRVVVFNVKYSPNLGDGLLSECLEAELTAHLPGASVESIDLAGRTAYSQGHRLRGSALAMLHHSPRAARHLVVEFLLGRKLRNHLQKRWRERLRHADAVVIGGGNLLSDADLNFPLKIDAAMTEVRAAGLPAAVYGVGVSDNWTRRGESLFRRALGGAPLCYAAVRDARSQDIWRRRMGAPDAEGPGIVQDPGVLASIHFPSPAARPSQAPRVGFGVMHPIAVKYHADAQTVSTRAHEAWCVALARACLARGWHLTVFTNGSPEDEDYLARLRPKLAAIDSVGSLVFASRLCTPGDLSRLISTFDLLLAHRLHANIAAYSYAIPQIGFAWDPKLKSFLTQVGRADCICSVGVDPVDEVVALAARELREGVDRVRHHAVLTQARADMARLGDALTAAAVSPGTVNSAVEPGALSQP